ncbi:MAG: glycosyltransferase family 4 protein [Magnetococcales bacterium]|nr:glycosyltransferase family 4 protein [Magnetococcales bacterium]
MRLAYLDPHPVPGTATVPLQILQMVDAFGKSGAEVHLITPRPAHPLTPAHILGHPISPQVHFHHLFDPRHHWWFPSGSNQPFFWQASRLLPKLAVDALFVRNIRLAARLLQQPPGRRLPLFFDTHELFANSFREAHYTLSLGQRLKLRRLSQTEALVYQRANGLLCTTPHLLEDIRQTYQTTTPGLASPLGYDAELAANALAESPFQPNRPPVLLFLGSLHAWKGISTLLEAMVMVDGAILKMVGGDALRHQALRQQAQSLGVADKIQWVQAIPPAQRFRMIHTADICLLPLSHRAIASRYTSPLKLFEYMAMGKPIITANLPSMRSLLEDGTHALLAEAEDATSLATAIRTLLDNPDLAHRLATAAQTLAQNYTWEKRAAQILAFITAQLSDTTRTVNAQ